MNGIGDWVSSLPSKWTEGCSPQVFAAARDAYASAGRFYHTWEHVLDCVGKLRAFDGAGRSVFLALLFHDAVYVPGRPDNEAQSAALATATLRRLAELPATELQAVERMILATRDHRLNADAGRDMAIALDVDMSILGAPWDAYRRYAEGVRREYCPAVTTERRFAAGRMAFLSRLLEAPSIFNTPEGAQHWERPARHNVAREVAELRAEAGPFVRLLARLFR